MTKNMLSNTTSKKSHQNRGLSLLSAELMAQKTVLSLINAQLYHHKFLHSSSSGDRRDQYLDEAGDGNILNLSCATMDAPGSAHKEYGYKLSVHRRPPPGPTLIIARLHHDVLRRIQPT